MLWCYLIWYCTTVYFYFDPSPRLWLNSLGISLIIGFALMLSVSKSADAPTDRWQTFRLFMMPFGVSSFSSLIKGQGFIFIIPPRPIEQIAAIGACALFIVTVMTLKRFVANS
ncbi:MAG: hypothetical protein QM709_02450 [Spongiibacteraceae bacterium]